jgi:outer membrane protein OmpA-like peptidoglycan-associated protein
VHREPAGAPATPSSDFAVYFQKGRKTADRFTLPGVTFPSGTSAMDPSAGPSLDRLATAMKQDPAARIRLEGHTDNRGEADHNAKLSYERASVVEKALVERGVAAKRIESIGLRDHMPIADNETRQGRAENRRVDAVVLKR